MEPDEDGEIFIDRNYEWFHVILNYLRCGLISVEGMKKREVRELEQEVDFFNLKRMKQIIEKQKIPKPPIGMGHLSCCPVVTHTS